MNRLIRRILILGGIFLFAAIAFIWFSLEPEEESVDYRAMESASIPVVTLEAEETAINVLYGYVADMEEAYLGESLTPLSEDNNSDKAALSVNNYASSTRLDHLLGAATVPHDVCECLLPHCKRKQCSPCLANLFHCSEQRTRNDVPAVLHVLNPVAGQHLAHHLDRLVKVNLSTTKH
jgi:hypothetical protein